MSKPKLVELLRFVPLLLGILGTLFLYLSFVKINGVNYYLDSYFVSNTGPSLKIILGILIIMVLTAGVLVMIRKRTLNAIAIVLFTLAITAFLLWPQIYVEAHGGGEVYLGLGLIVNIALLVLALGLTLREFFSKFTFSIREMIESAILIGLAIVFDFIPKIRVGGSGGSISLTMLPLFIIAFRFTFVKSFINIGVVYGLLTCLFDGYGFATYPFDYLIGFGLISLSSLFRKLAMNDKFPLYLQYVILGTGILVGGLSRFIGSTMSSMIIYQTTLWGGLSYNATYIIPSVAFSLVFLLLLFPLLKRLQLRYPPKD